MRAMIWIVSGLALLWGAYWVVASRAVDSGLRGWMAQAQVDGLVAEVADLGVSGFPNRIDVTATDLHLANPQTGMGWRAPWVQVFSMTWKPWHLIAAFPPGQVVDLPGQSVTVDGSGMMASAELIAGTSMALKQLRVAGDQIVLSSSAGWSLRAQTVLAATGLDATRANTHRIGLTVTELAPDAAFTASLGDPTLPDSIPRLHLDGFLTFSAPIDRFAEASQPRMIGVDLRDLSLKWGSLGILGSGLIAPGADGLAEGELALTITNWRLGLRVVVAMGWLTSDQAQVLERGLQTMAEAGPDPDVLTLPLRAANGRLLLGPLPIGAAPRLN